MIRDALKPVNSLPFVVFGVGAIVHLAGGFDTLYAKHAVKEMLRDPDSARFAGVFRSDLDGCVYGNVTGKNGLGGYALPESFIYDPKTGTAALQSQLDQYLKVTAGCIVPADSTKES